MKKFLFTLASLFVAGTAFANSFLYLDKLEVTEDMIGTEIEVPVKAHFEEYVSAWDATIRMPEGLTIVDFMNGADMTVSYFNQRGRAMTVDGAVTTNDNQHFIAIISATTSGYYQAEDGTWVNYGQLKWEPGDYDEMMILYVQVSAIPTGDAYVTTVPAAGADPRDIPLATTKDGATDLPWGWTPGEEPQPAPEPTFREADGKLYAECEGHEVVLMLGDKAVDNPYTLPEATFVEQVLNFTAYTVANADESENSAEVPYQVTIAAKDNAKAPAPTFRVEDGKLYAESAQGLDVVMMLNGDECENPYTLPTENTSYTEDIVLNFTAYAVADGVNYNINSDNATYEHVVAHLTKKAVESPSIMITDRTDETITISIFPDENTDGELEYEATPAPGAKATELVYTRGDADYTVTVKARTLEGPTCLASDWAEETFTIEKKPAPEVTKTPSVTYSYENGELNVWAYGSDDDAVYTLYCDGVEYTGEMPIAYDIYEGYNHTWTATAIAPGKTVSEMSAECKINIPAEEKVYITPDPEFGTPVVNVYNVTVPVTGEGHLVITVTLGEKTLNFEGDNAVNVVIPRGEYDDFAIINATATPTVPDGFDSVQPGQATSGLIDIPALVYTETPNINVNYGKAEWNEDGTVKKDGRYAEVTITSEDGAVIEYSLDGGKTWLTYDGMILIEGEGEYEVMARATATGKATAENSAPVVITKATGVNELVNGKAVAGVRYFNMAGQEMKEANGVTIVVTTYTDGTTSAVKVIK